MSQTPIVSQMSVTAMSKVKQTVKPQPGELSPYKVFF